MREESLKEAKSLFVQISLALDTGPSDTMFPPPGTGRAPFTG